eukprot:4171379-Prymnesium_polylepis.1
MSSELKKKEEHVALRRSEPPLLLKFRNFSRVDYSQTDFQFFAATSVGNVEALALRLTKTAQPARPPRPSRRAAPFAPGLAAVRGGLGCPRCG